VKARNGERRVLATPEEVADAAADLLLTVAAKNPRACVALSGGSTPRAMYQALAGRGGEARERLRNIHFFFGDERAVANDHPDSNVRLAQELLFAPVEISPERVHPLNGAAPDLEQEAQRATRELREWVPSRDGVPLFDLIFLGMGDDGHTASLFPGTAALQSDEAGYVANDVPQLNTRRLTLTYPVLNAASLVAILCTGEKKAPVLEQVFQMDRKPHYPIEYLQAEKTLWLLDKSAAKGL
jgi:6-phosphogluconolactonase